MKKSIYFSLLSIIFISSSCTNNFNTITNKDTLINNVINNSSNKTISGFVDWSDGFKIKATLADIAPYGTVSIIYPHNHSTKPNRTVATGVTDATGNFTITPDGTFTPLDKEIFILEVTKRIGGVNNNLMSLRTFIRWNQSTNNWSSITTNGVVINRKTTALTLITNAENFDPERTIGTVNSSVNPTTTTDVTFIPLKNIFVGTDTSFQTHIFSTNSDGSSSTSPSQISGISTNNTTPVISKDASKVLFIGNDGTTNQIYVANTNPPYNPTQISTNGSTNNQAPKFSDDGNKIVFVGTVSTVNHIFVATSNGSGGYNTPVQVSSGTTINNTPSFSPDGNKIVFVGRDTTPNIFIADTVSPFNQTKVSTGTSTNNSTPSFSPDGNKIVFIGRDATLATNIVYLANSISPFNPTLRSNNSLVTACASPSFSPDSSKIVFRGTENAVQHIYLANVGDTSLPDKVTSTTTSNSNPIFSPDGTKIAFTCTDLTALQVYTSNTISPYTLSKLNGASTSNSNISFSADSSKVAFNGQENTETNIYVANSDGSGSPVKITNATTTTSNSTPIFTRETKFTSTQIDNVSNLVLNVLNANYDPVRYIAKQGSNYVTTNP
ncbi:MAG: hypothetical protein U0354_14270 [Candidatus Sericytochromatia bacterium]